MAQPDPDFEGITERALAQAIEHLAPAGLGSLPQPIRDAVNDVMAETRIVLALARMGADGKAELRAKKDLLPRSGFERLNRELVENVRGRADQANRAARRALDRLSDAAFNAAIPPVEPAREQLARGEAELVIRRTGDGFLGAAQSASREAQAVLASPYGKTLLSAFRGLNGRELDHSHQQLRTIVTASAIERGTASEQAAALAHQRSGALGAAVGSASTAVNMALG